MKILHISDTHTLHKGLSLNLKNIDVIIHSGDASNSSNPKYNFEELYTFLEWFKELPVKHKIFVPGNHDVSLDSNYTNNKLLFTVEEFKKENIHLLINKSVTIENKIFYGNPYTPTFGNWAFMKPRDAINNYWQKNFNRLADVVITHGPPRGILDGSVDRYNNKFFEHVGDAGLLNQILNSKCKLHCFGHVHNNSYLHNAGVLNIKNRLFSNGAIVKDGNFSILNLQHNGHIIDI